MCGKNVTKTKQFGTAHIVFILNDWLVVNTSKLTLILNNFEFNDLFCSAELKQVTSLCKCSYVCTITTCLLPELFSYNDIESETETSKSRKQLQY